MRQALAALALCALLGGASAALAAPTCQNRQGDVVRCDAADAMPVGWTVSPEQFWNRQAAKTPDPGAGEVLYTFIGIGLLFALIALLPEFDGRRDRDWGGDDED